MEADRYMAEARELERMEKERVEREYLSYTARKDLLAEKEFKNLNSYSQRKWEATSHISSIEQDSISSGDQEHFFAEVASAYLGIIPNLITKDYPETLTAREYEYLGKKVLDNKTRVLPKDDLTFILLSGNGRNSGHCEGAYVNSEGYIFQFSHDIYYDYSGCDMLYRPNGQCIYCWACAGQFLCEWVMGETALRQYQPPWGQYNADEPLDTN